MDWTPIWHQAAAPAFAMGFLAGKKKTVVYSVISHVSGEKLRVRFSNHYGKKPYTIGGTDRVGTGRDAYRHAGRQLCFHGSRGGMLLFG